MARFGSRGEQTAFARTALGGLVALAAFSSLDLLPWTVCGVAPVDAAGKCVLQDAGPLEVLGFQLLNLVGMLAAGMVATLVLVRSPILDLAVRDGRAPGNAFARTAGNDVVVLADAGDELHVDGVVYRVEAVDVLAKEAAARAPEIWAPHDDGEDRLVVITCLQRPGAVGPAAENLVLYAMRAC